MFCPMCGKKCEDWSRFCMGCGFDFSSAEKKQNEQDGDSVTENDADPVTENDEIPVAGEQTEDAFADETAAMTADEILNEYEENAAEQGNGEPESSVSQDDKKKKTIIGVCIGAAVAVVIIIIVIIACSSGKNDNKDTPTTAVATTGFTSETTTANAAGDNTTTEADTSAVNNTSGSSSSSYAHYISNRSVDYDSANSRHRVFFGFKVSENSENIAQKAEIAITITNDDGVTVFSKTYNVDESDYSTWTSKLWDSSKYLGCIYINDSEITAGSSDDGTLTLSATLPNGTTFSEDTMSINNLPLSELDITLLNSLPCEINEYGFRGELEHTVVVTNVEFEYTNISNIKIYITAQMTYNSEGSSHSDYSHIGYKIKDSSGVIVSSGDVQLSPMAVGDTITDYSYSSGNDIVLGEHYTIELSDTD